MRVPRLKASVRASGWYLVVCAPLDVSDDVLHGRQALRERLGDAEEDKIVIFVALVHCVTATSVRDEAGLAEREGLRAKAAAAENVLTSSFVATNFASADGRCVRS